MKLRIGVLPALGRLSWFIGDRLLLGPREPGQQRAGRIQRFNEIKSEPFHERGGIDLLEESVYIPPSERARYSETGAAAGVGSEFFNTSSMGLSNSLKDRIFFVR